MLWHIAMVQQPSGPNTSSPHAVCRHCARGAVVQVRYLRHDSIQGLEVLQCLGVHVRPCLAQLLSVLCTWATPAAPVPPPPRGFVRADGSKIAPDTASGSGEGSAAAADPATPATAAAAAEGAATAAAAALAAAEAAAGLGARFTASVRMMQALYEFIALEARQDAAAYEQVVQVFSTQPVLWFPAKGVLSAEAAAAAPEVEGRFVACHQARCREPAKIVEDIPEARLPLRIVAL